WAESLGMNTMRVFLHDLLWQQDADGFKKRINEFLTIAAKHRIRQKLVDALLETISVLLPEQVMQEDAHREFLTIAAKHRIRPVFVLFDSCWDPLPHPGPQHPPIPGVHNSGW